MNVFHQQITRTVPKFETSLPEEKALGRFGEFMYPALAGKHNDVYVSDSDKSQKVLREVICEFVTEYHRLPMTSQNTTDVNSAELTPQANSGE